MGPKISIIVPVYNVSAYIRRCVNSVASQTYKNIEVILLMIVARMIVYYKSRILSQI